MSLRGYIKKGKPALWTTMRQKPKRQPKPKRIRSVSIRRQVRNRAYIKAARSFVAEAVARGQRCPVVAAVPELRAQFRYGHPVSDKLNEVHHMRGRAGSLLLDQRHWLAVSKAGHRWIHSHVAEARSRGWICEDGKWNTPEL